MSSVSLTERAVSVLKSNDTGLFTKPGPHQYPHQWNWDSALIALGHSYFDLPRAQLEIRSLLSGQWQDGMLPHVVYHDIPSDYFPPATFWQIENSPYAPRSSTSGITQPPLLATVVRTISSRFPMQNFVNEVYPALLRWHRWMHTTRDSDGSGLTCILHPWESGTDDSPRWLKILDGIQPDGLPEFHRGDTKYVSAVERPHRAEYERFIYLIDLFRRLRYEPNELLAQSPFLVQDVLFNSILFRADEDLHALAMSIGQPTQEIDGWLMRMRANFNSHFWDEKAGLYYDFDVRSGRPIQVNTASTFLPLFAGLATKEQAQRLIHGHLLNPDEYSPGRDIHHWVTTTARTESTWEPRRYWRGPIWIIMNWFLIDGLLRYGFPQLAETIRLNSLALIEAEGFREYYDAGNGSGCGSDRFSWTAALTLEFLNSP